MGSRPHGISDLEDEDLEDEITRRDNDILDMMHIFNFSFFVIGLVSCS